MIYADTSIVLGELLAEDRHPPAEFWDELLVSSRLLQCETWVRIGNGGLLQSHGEAASDLLSRFAFLELSQPVLARALEPFPVPIRTLDALHLASLDFLRKQGQKIELASYDVRLNRAASAIGIQLRKA